MAKDRIAQGLCFCVLDRRSRRATPVRASATETKATEQPKGTVSLGEWLDIANCHTLASLTGPLSARDSITPTALHQNNRYSDIAHAFSAKSLPASRPGHPYLPACGKPRFSLSLALAGALFGGLPKLGVTGTVQLGNKKKEEKKGPAARGGRDDSVVRAGQLWGSGASVGSARVGVGPRRSTLVVWAHPTQIAANVGLVCVQTALHRMFFASCNRNVPQKCATVCGCAGVRGWLHGPHRRPRRQVGTQPCGVLHGVSRRVM